MEGRSRRTRPDIDLRLGEDVETTRQYGLYFLEHLEQARDKAGGLVAAEFLHLPAPAEHPDYYAKVAHPIAFDGIKAKLMQLQYPDIAALEADVKLLIFNAKQYYKKNSSTFDDAERVRKMLSDFVRKNLPRNGSIGSPITPRAFAPGSSTGRSYNRKRKKYDEDGDGEIDADGEVNGNEDEFGEPATKRPRLDDMSQEFDMNGTSESIDESVEEHSNWPNYSSSDFKDCSMQAAQEIIVKECKTLVDADGDNFTAIFHDRPSRKLLDYYQLIKRPVSLNSIRKQVAGVQSRGESTGRSTFKYWEDFEKEMELIWLNAREYNEDDSQITKDSYILEDFVNTRIRQAKRYVPDPPGPTMKLRLGKEPASSVKLTLALPRLQPAPSPSPSPFVKPPSEASASIHATTPILQPAAQIRPPMGIMPTHPAIARLTSHELVHDRSLSPIQPPIQPPSAIGTPLPTSSFPPTPALPNGIPASAPPTTPDPNPLNPTLYDPAGLPYGPDSLLRRPNRTAANALISSLTLTSHPSLKLPQTFTQLFLPSDRFSQLAHTLHLPAAVSSLQLSLVVAKEMQVRASKVVCSFRGGVLKPVRSVPTPTPNTTTTTTTATTTTTTTTTTTATTPAATTTTTEGGAAVEIPAPQTMQYELALAPGSNVIEFDAIAANAKEVPKRADTGDVDHEKVQLLVFLHLPSSVDGVVEGMGRL